MINTRNTLRAAGASLALAGASVYAAVPADVTTALADLKTDALTVAGIFLVAIVALVAFKFLRKAIS